MTEGGQINQVDVSANCGGNFGDILASNTKKTGDSYADSRNLCDVCGRYLVSFFAELSCLCSKADSAASGGQFCLQNRRQQNELDSSCQAQPQESLELKTMDQVVDDEVGFSDVVGGKGACASDVVPVLQEQS